MKYHQVDTVLYIYSTGWRVKIFREDDFLFQAGIRSMPHDEEKLHRLLCTLPQSPPFKKADIFSLTKHESVL